MKSPKSEGEWIARAECIDTDWISRECGCMHVLDLQQATNAFFLIIEEVHYYGSDIPILHGIPINVKHCRN